MKTHFTILLIIICLKGYSTLQVNDILIYKGDTLFAYNSPLSQIDSFTIKLNDKIYELYDYINYSSDCERGFSAKWIILENSLYLSEVYECCSENVINEIVEKILDKKFIYGLIKADWVDSVLWCGKDYVWEQSYYTSIFQKEYKFLFNNGKLLETEESEYKECELFVRDTSEHILPVQLYKQELIDSFIISNMDWSVIPKPDDNEIRLYAWINYDENSRITEIILKSTSDSTYISEFKNALNRFPCFPRHYYKGEFWEFGLPVRININEEKIRKYVR